MKKLLKYLLIFYINFKTMEFFKNFDLLRKQISLNSFGSEKYSTNLGAFLSILLYVAGIYLFSYYLKQITNRDLQNIIIKYETEANSPEFVLTDFIPYIVRIEDFYSNAINNDSIVSVESNYLNCNYACKGENSLRLNLTNCKEENFPRKYQESFIINKLDTALCVNFEDNPQLNGSLTISGSWSEDHINYLNFSAKVCFNKSSCLSSDELTKFINENRIFLNLYTLEEHLNPQNYYVPEVNSVKNSYIRVVNKMYKEMQLYRTLTKIISDIGVVNVQNNYSQIFSNDVHLSDISYFSNQPISFGSFLIYSNSEAIYVTRYYMKLQTLISFLLTIFNALTIIMKLLFGNIIEKYYYEDIINRFIDFERKDIYLKYIEENTHIPKRTIQNHTDKHNLRKLKQREELQPNIIINDNLNQNVEDDINNKLYIPQVKIVNILTKTQT